MLGGFPESGLRNFFRSNLPPLDACDVVRYPNVEPGGTGGWRPDARNVVFGESGKACEIFSVNSPPGH